MNFLGLANSRTNIDLRGGGGTVPDAEKKGGFGRAECSQDFVKRCGTVGSAGKRGKVPRVYPRRYLLLQGGRLN